MELVTKALALAAEYGPYVAAVLAGVAVALAVIAPLTKTKLEQWNATTHAWDDVTGSALSGTDTDRPRPVCAQQLDQGLGGQRNGGDKSPVKVEFGQMQIGNGAGGTIGFSEAGLRSLAVVAGQNQVGGRGVEINRNNVGCHVLHLCVREGITAICAH